ncbi:MAG: hypothetical protein ABSA46_19810 [Thermodesulfovibrionales bacterium]
MAIAPLIGKPAEPSIPNTVPRMVSVYYTGQPDPSVAEQRIAFGTSGHRGSPIENAFDEAHILAITQAICLYLKQHHGRNGERSMVSPLKSVPFVVVPL